MLHVHLLGKVRAVRANEVFSRFRTRKAEALLAYLAHYRDRRHSRDELLDLLWPDVAPEAARNSLSVSLSSLRTLLEAAGDRSGLIFEADRHTLGVVAGAITTDVQTFEAAVKAAETSPPGSAAELQLLDDAVSAYTGPFLSEHDGNWVLFEQRRLASQFERVLHRLIERLLENQRWGQALDRARHGIACDPWSETAHGDLMRILVGMSDVDGALRHFEQLEALAARQESVSLGTSLKAMAAELLQQRTAGALTTAVGNGPAPAMEPQPAAVVTAPAASGMYSLLLVGHATDLAEVARRVGSLGGRALRSTGDSAAFAYARASEALDSALRLHRETAAQACDPAGLSLALHLGEFCEPATAPAARDADDPVLTWAERLLAAAHPGQIVCSEPAAALLRRELPPGVWLRDVGLYRLVGRAVPEHVFQVDYPEMSVRQFPALHAAGGHTSRLPMQLTRFFGREQAMEELEDLVLGGEARLVTVLGPGGIGKTRLCLETARRMVDAMGGAVWFVPLADALGAEQVEAKLRDSLNLPELPGADPLAQVAELIAERPALLVLDNLEQVAEAGAEVIRDLLQRAPKAICLVSSRVVLGLAGEREYRLAPLAVPSPPFETEQVLLSESARLFLDRARAVRPDFHLSAANAAEVAELCTRLEGVPLALELAASRVVVMTLSQMLAKLGQALDILSTRLRSVPERHRTLRAATAWSYELLPPPLQRLYARLSVFRGGWTAEAAETVCDEPMALDGLAQLRECSLIETTDGDGVRFRMLDTIRAFAAEQLQEEGSGQSVRERHFAYYLGLASAGQTALEQGDDEAWLERLEVERPNFAAAFDWAFGHDPVGAVQLAGALWRYWLVRGHWTEAEQLLERALEQAPEAPPELRARALGWTGHVCFRRGHYDRAEKLLKRSLAVCQELGNSAGAGNALNELGKVAWATGDHAAARHYYEQSLAIRQTLGNEWSIAATVANLGVAAWALGDSQRAEDCLQQALQLRRELGDRRGAAGTLRNLGSLAQARSDYESAQRHLEESLSIWRDLGDRGGVSQSLSELGLVAHARGDFATAWDLHTQSLTIRQQIGDERGTAASLVNLGAVAMERGEYEGARDQFAESLRICRAIGDRQGIAVALNNLGDVTTVLDRVVEATDFYQQALALQRELGDRGQIAVVLNNLGEAALAGGRLTEAQAWFEQCLEAARGDQNRYLMGYAHAGLGEVALSLGDLATARRQHAESLTVRSQIGDRAGIARSLDSVAALLSAEGAAAEAITLLGASEALREQLKVQLRPAEARRQAGLRHCLGAATGDDEFESCWLHGHGLDLKTAIRLAVG